MALLDKTAIVTGGSSGIGRAAAAALSAAGYRVFEFSRSGTDFDAVTHRTVDITDETALFDAVRSVAAETGGLDLLVCNAGTGISGAVEITELAEARHLFEVDFFGAAACARAALPALRARKGRIIFVGSVAGLISIPFQAYYSAAKAAIGSLSDALRGEVAPFGISVCCVLPGDVRTGFTAARTRDDRGDDLYSGRIARSVGGMEKDEQNGMSPETVARFLVRVAQKRRVAPTYVAGTAYRLLVFLTRILPRSAVRYFVSLLYAR